MENSKCRMKVRLLCFGMAREAIGESALSFEWEGDDSDSLRSALLAAYPNLASLPPWTVAVNEEYAHDNRGLKDGDEVAIIPPVSGG